MKPDLVAPGNRIISVNANSSYLSSHYGAIDAVGLPEYSTLTDAPADTYLRLSGTSMAAPVVAGAAALLLQADPTLTPDTIKARLMISADKTGYGTGGAGRHRPLHLRRGLPQHSRRSAKHRHRDAARPQPVHYPRCVGNCLRQHPAPACRRDRRLGNRSIGWGRHLGADYFPRGRGGRQLILWGRDHLGGQSVWNDQIIWGESWSGTDLSSTALIGDPDALTARPIRFLLP